MKLIVLTFLLFLSGFAFGNMACPWIEGTNSSTPLTSKNIDITRENLFIKLNKKFDEAEFRIQYYINNPESGIQIPLLFFAERYKSDFKVWLDGKEIEVRKIEDFIKQTKHTKFSGFHQYFDVSDSERDHPETISIFWSEHVGNVYKLNDLQYFEIDLSKGAHCIEVTYTADKYTMINDRDFFIYSLSPAEHWKSFNQLFVEIDNTVFGKVVSTNLGKPLSGSLDSIARWEFNRLPNKFIEIAHSIRTGKKNVIQKENTSESSFQLIFIASVSLCSLLLFVIIKSFRR